MTPQCSSPRRELSTPSLSGPPPRAGRLLSQGIHSISHPGWPPSGGGILSPSNSSAILLHPGTVFHAHAVPTSARVRSSRSPVQHKQHGGGTGSALIHMVAATPRHPGPNNTGASCDISTLDAANVCAHPLQPAGGSCNLDTRALKPQQAHVVTAAESALQVEIARRQAAESRVRELEALCSKLRSRLSMLEDKRAGSPRRGSDSPGSPRPRAENSRCESPRPDTVERIDDPIDRAICAYLERNPDFPVSIQKVARNYYVFGDRGTVYVTQRGEHIVVRVGGGFKSLQVFMDERALMVQQANNTSVMSDKSQSQNAAVAA